MYVAVEYTADLGKYTGYVGFDIDTVEAHPTDGSDGIMVVFFDGSEGFSYDEFDRIEAVDNNYLWLFSCPETQDPAVMVVAYMSKLDEKLHYTQPWLPIGKIPGPKFTP